MRNFPRSLSARPRFESPLFQSRQSSLTRSRRHDLKGGLEMPSGAGRAEAQSSGSAPAAGQLQQTADAFQHRGHPQQAVCEKELLPERGGAPRLSRREAALGGSKPVRPRASQSNVPALRARGIGQQNVQGPGGQRPAGSRG